MALYLVIHSPRTDDVDSVRPPTRLRELANRHSTEGTSPRWLQTWSPDLHDDRIFSLWNAESAEAIRKIIDEYGFLDDLEAHPINVRAWGPDDVLASGSDGDS
ncbi:MAG TPA: hypothetical protein VEW66_05380 [Thermomicrobiales bacterium]|nr:hypothetical protein [Thermomicrobiales bacterium]